MIYFLKLITLVFLCNSAFADVIDISTEVDRSSVSIEINAESVVEMPFLGLVRITQPYLLFSENIGYGNKVNIFISKDSLNSEYICNKFGYGNFSHNEGKIEFTESQFIAFPRDRVIISKVNGSGGYDFSESTFCELRENDDQ